jgi:transposase
MQALAISNKSLSKQKLLELAERTPGAWLGIRIAGLLLILSGWKSTAVADLLGLSRWGVVKWIERANREGVQGVLERPGRGRKSRISPTCREDLKQVILKSPQEAGIARARWDGVVVMEYLAKKHGIKIRVRRAQVLLHELGLSLKQPMYHFAQATGKGVRQFHGLLKKTSSNQEGV